jgi:hypothetical protein
MGAIEISGIGVAMIEQGVFFDAGAAMATVLLSLLGIAAAGIIASRATRRQERPLAWSTTPAIAR